ncbi:hypothetical protein ALC56_00558, partial [Trachymyrmex septentrionalis]
FIENKALLTSTELVGSFIERSNTICLGDCLHEDILQAVGKVRRKSKGILLRPEAPNEPGVKWKTNQCTGRTLTPDVPVRPYALAFGHGA